MSRLLPLSGILAVAFGLAWLVPALAVWLGRGALEPHYAVISLGPILILCGVVAACCGSRKLDIGSIPPPVRAIMAGNALFLAFCAMELSDGLVRQGGRIFYWTSVLFFPALLLFYGQVLGRRWAWWAARVLTGLFTIWCMVFLVLIPFADLRGEGGAIPWWGRIYVASVTLVLAGSSAYAFRLLGQAQTRAFYRVAHEA